MAITFTRAELETLSALRQNAQAGAGYWRCYEYIAQQLEAKGVSLTDPALLWFKGATEANAGRGAFSKLIREYTNAQYAMRVGGTPDMQAASDAVAIRVLDDLLVNPVTKGIVPTINQIAENDASAVGDTLFNLPNDTANSPTNAAWSGTLLFTLLNSNQTNRLIASGSSNTLDTLNDWRDVLFAKLAIEKALLPTALEFVSQTPIQKAKDVAILGSTLVGFFNANQNKPAADYLFGTASSSIKSAVEVIDKVGPANLIDWMLASLAGEPTALPDNLTNQARAKALHDGIGIQGQQWQTRYQTGAQLLSLANGNGVDAQAARNALVALSPFMISGTGVNLDARDLNDMSEFELKDRAGFVSAKVNALNAFANQSAGAGEFVYRDLTLNETVVTGIVGPIGADRKTQIVMGNSRANTLNGQQKDDRLYGGAGTDTLNGNGGNDRLEGGTGDDNLIGGSGDDKLYGGKGSDSYRFESGEGTDTIKDSDGLGSVYVSELQLDKANAAGQKNQWKTKDNKFNIKLINGDLTTGGKLEISGSGLGTGKVVVEDFKNLNLGIELETKIKTSVSKGVAKNDYQTADHNAGATQHTANAKEGGGKQIRIDLNQAAKAGDKVTIAASGDGSDKFSAVTGNDSIKFGNGPIEITLAEGQTQVYLAVVNDGDVDTDGAITLTSGYIANDGRDTSEAADTFVLNLDATDEATQAATTNTILGDKVTESGELLPYDNINATDGNDFINSLTENDTINAYDGDDTIHGGTGEDLVKGGRGNDLIIGNEDRDILIGGEGDDTLYAMMKPDNLDDITTLTQSQQGSQQQGELLSGGAGEDKLIGDAGDDVLVGGDGDDTLYGLGGDDVIVADWNIQSANRNWAAYKESIGEDNLQTHVFITGSSSEHDPATDAPYGGNDTVFGGRGNDIIDGGKGDDLLDGGADNDEITGQGGADVLLGGAGDDTLIGGWTTNSEVITTIPNFEDGDDFLDGGAGNDRLYGNQGNDVLNGGAGSGADTLYGNDGDDVLNGGAGNDFMIGDDLKYREGAGNDTLDGGEGDDQIMGGAGNDTLYGSAGNDTLFGDAAVTINGQADTIPNDKNGDDILDGGDGNDLIIGNGGNDILFGGEGDDELQGDAVGKDYGSFEGKDTLYGEAGNDLLRGRGGDDVLEGGKGDDELQGDAGNDTLDGGDDKDRLFGGAGEDTLNGGTGTENFLNGQSGNDTLISEGIDDTLRGGDGDDSLTANGGRAELFGEAGDDSINGSTAEGNVLRGGDGNDSIVSIGINDKISGDDGDDMLDATGAQSANGGWVEIQGGQGNDVLLGGNGTNHLYEQAGKDSLVGDVINDLEAVIAKNQKSPIGGQLQAKESQSARPDCTLQISKASIINGITHDAANDNQYARAA